MSKPINQEHEELLNLRSAILGKPQAIKQRDELIGKKNASKFTLTPPNNYVPAVYSYTDEVRQAYEGPLVKPVWDAADKKAKELAEKEARAAVKSSSPSNAAGIFGRVLLIIVLSALVVGILALGVYLIYLSSTWSWNASIKACMSSKYLWYDGGFEYPTAVSVHLMALALCCLGMLFAFMSLAENCHDAFRVGTYTCGGLSILLPIVALFYFYSVAGGFWMGILYTFVFILMIPKFIIHLIYVVPFFLSLGGTIAGTIWLIYLIRKAIRGIKGNGNTNKLSLSEKNKAVYERTYKSTYDRVMKAEYTPPNINYAALYRGKEYKEAEEKERKEMAERKTAYTKQYNDELAQHNNLIKAYNDAISQYNLIINRCDATIKNSNLLHDSQKNLEVINVILYYFDCRRARTVSEALNVYNTDLHQMRMEQGLAELQRATTIAIESGVERLSTQLSAMQTAISKDIASVNSTLNAQTAAIEKSLEKIRRANDRNADMIADQQRKANTQLGYIGQDVYIHRIQ